MALRFFTIGTLVAVTALAAASDVSTSRHTHLRPSVAPGSSPLRMFGVRGAQQRGSSAAKFDGALADLSRHANLARPDHAVEDLQSLAPGVKFVQTAAGAAPLVLIDAVTVGDPQQLKAALVALGLQRPSVYSNDVGGWLPVSQLGAATARAEVHSIRAAMARTRTGAVTSQGDYVQQSVALRSLSPPLTGAGVTVGVLSDSFDCYTVYAANNVAASGAAGYASNGFLATYATDVSTGDLPSNVNVLEEAEAGNGGCLNYGAPSQLPFTDEGRAMLQIVHDVAPGASLAFYSGDNSEADFANGIGKLAAPVSAGGAGAKVIADDLGYFDEPFFQDGIVAQAVDAVEANGVAYFSAAGNDGTLAYDNTAPSFGTLSSSAPNSGEYLLNFDASGATTTASLPVTIASMVPGEFVAIVVEWDQPYVTGAANSGGATSQIDVCLIGSGPDEITDYDNKTATCSGPNAVGSDSYQVMIVGNPASASGNTAAENLTIQVGLAGGTKAPGRIKVVVEDDGAGSTINAFQTNTATIQGHPGAVGAAAVGAAFFFDTPACGTTPAQLEYFSSAGGAPILFDSNGTRLTTPVYRQKPDFVGPDGVNNTFLGFTLASDGFPNGGTLNTSNASCQNDTNYPNFFGTSAATPHAASIAALLLQANPAATPTQIYQAVRSSALPMNSPSPSFVSGYGFIQADTALVVPTMSLAATAVAPGGTTTLTWTSVGASSCTASGPADWSGVQAPSGSQTVTMSTVGTNTYTLNCLNASGTVSASSSVSLTDVVPAAPVLVLSQSAINLGQSSTITWSSANAASCTASGNWSGSLPASGSQAVVPTAGGTATYSLTCANVIGSSAAGSASLAVTVPPPPAAPSLKLAANSITVGNSTTITWSSVDALVCTASGSWSGSQLGTSGSQTVQPTATGTNTYTLTCVNDGGASPAASVKLMVTAAPSSGGGGGGGLDVLALLGLAGVGAARFHRLRPRVLT
jgi:hypothetical protein